MPGPTTDRAQMPRPTASLRTEHGVITLGLETLGVIARHVQAGGSFPTADTASLLSFLREFVLAVHMRKEAEVVWPAIAMRGDDRSAALVGELLRSHEAVTELVHSLIMFWEPVDDLSSSERQGFADTVTTLSSHVLRMQGIEETLLRACETTVPADDQLDWPQRFAELEVGRRSCRSWSKRLTDLARTWMA